MLRGVMLVAWRDFIAVVRTKGFIIGLVFLPGVIAVSALIPKLWERFAEAGERRFVVADFTGQLGPVLAEQVAKGNEKPGEKIKIRFEPYDVASQKSGATRPFAETTQELELELARRAKADFINYQDRVRRDKADWNRQALEGFVRELLPAMDGFSMAKFEDPKLLEAVRLLEKEFLRVLAKTGVTPIETAGKAFDPLYHDAVAMEPGGTQLEEVRRGWLFDGKVLQAASVRLINPKPAP